MTVSLHETPPETILAALEKRSDALHSIEYKEATAEADFKIFEAQQFKAMLDSKISATAAKELIREREGWRDKYLELQALRCDAAEAKRSYQRAVIASELWRSVNANNRKVQ